MCVQEDPDSDEAQEASDLRLVEQTGPDRIVWRGQRDPRELHRGRHDQAVREQGRAVTARVERHEAGRQAYRAGWL